MKRSLVLLLMLVLAFMFTACATGPSVCETRENQTSYLCEASDQLGVKLEDAGNIFMIANIVAIEKGSYSREEAAEVMKEILFLVNSSPSYSYIARIVREKVDSYPGLFLVAEVYLASMNRTQIISTFDRKILASWLQQQIAILGGL